ncbi:ferredoxin [Amycolatopsis suaedae]|uniref:Ferredoxin n=1 Tax=Amycolatopsis suaedae TaxID=2510978 RepID=A0A4Q7J5J7_9PSEU|nr:ferredoxin [Amycolatopsis suaedae]RZQ62379.1 ferredoxin [Amycolatopsis suaedae]
MKVTVVPDRCVGGGHCALAAPEVFDQDDDGMVVVLDADPGPGQHDAAREAAMLCPTAAIVLREEA